DPNPDPERVRRSDRRGHPAHRVMLHRLAVHRRLHVRSRADLHRTLSAIDPRPRARQPGTRRRVIVEPDYLTRLTCRGSVWLPDADPAPGEWAAGNGERHASHPRSRAPESQVRGRDRKPSPSALRWDITRSTSTRRAGIADINQVVAPESPVRPRSAQAVGLS